MIFNSKQLEKLSELCLDLAKALFVSAFAIPALVNAYSLMLILRALALGFFFTYIGLSFLERNQ